MQYTQIPIKEKIDTVNDLSTRDHSQGSNLSYEDKLDQLPVLKALIEQQVLHSMHLPAHSQNNSVLPYFCKAMQEFGPMAMEGTTDDDFGKMGNFWPPSSSYKDSLIKASRIYGSKFTFFGVNGSTGLLEGVMRLVGGSKTVALIQRNSHRSIIHGLRDTGAQLRWVFPDFNEEFHIFMPVTPDLIKKSIEKHTEINVVVLMTPTYEGLAANITEIGQICKENNITLVLDSSHGSLFPFVECMPQSGLHVPGVDLIVHSVHKGAGAASQTSVVHVTKDSKIQETKAIQALQWAASTSPSTWLLASIEEAIYQNSQQQRKELIQSHCEQMTALKKALMQNAGIKILEESSVEKDLTKMCVKVEGYSGKHIRDHLRTNCIDPEFFNEKCVLMSYHVGTKAEALNKVKETLENLANHHHHHQHHHHHHEEVKTFSKPQLPIPEYAQEKHFDVFSIFTQTEEVTFKNAVGRISAQIKSPCPPGCIVLDIGERVQQGHMVFFNPDEKISVVIE